MKSFILKFFLFFFVVLFLVFSFRLFVPVSFIGNFYEDTFGKTKTIIDVSSGESFYSIAQVLEQKKLIRQALDLKLLVLITGRPSLKKGEYELSHSMSLWAIYQVLKKGKEREFQVSFPEGFNHYEMAELLKSYNYKQTDEFRSLVWDKAFIKNLIELSTHNDEEKTIHEELIKVFREQGLNSLEGYLFPDSYVIKKYLPARKLIKAMFNNFIKNYKKLSQIPLDLSLHEIVTLASIVEKETGLASERPLIASVFFNRLKINQKLQTDPTILYSLYLVRGFDMEKNIRKKDILFPSSYNTYVIKGLPPGPIANPGKESLKAVFEPSSSDFFYFVSRNDGSHYFSKTYEEHKKAVYQYQIQKR